MLFDLGRVAMGELATSDPLVVLSIVDAVLVAMFFLFRVLPWTQPGPWRLIWALASLSFALFILGEMTALFAHGSAVSFEHQGPIFAAILAMTVCFILVYLHGHRATERALSLALTDELTKLDNMRAFEPKLAAALHRRKPFALVVLHLGGLQEVNDLFGPHRGDVVLQQFADALRRSVRDEDLAARLGGGKFAIFLSGTDAAAAQATAQRLLAAARDVASRETASPDIDMSFGVATDEDGDTARQLLRAADSALYRARGSGGSRAVSTASAPDRTAYPND